MKKGDNYDIQANMVLCEIYDLSGLHTKAKENEAVALVFLHEE